MVVLDASCLVELLLNTALGEALAQRISDPNEALHVPHLADVEVLQTLRRHLRMGSIRAAQAQQAMRDLAGLVMERHSHLPLLDFAWRWRDNVTAYDAMYLGLADLLDAPLITLDARLARAPGVRVRVELLRPALP